jgi:hypothetical protein
MLQKGFHVKDRTVEVIAMTGRRVRPNDRDGVAAQLAADNLITCMRHYDAVQGAYLSRSILNYAAMRIYAMFNAYVT